MRLLRGRESSRSGTRGVEKGKGKGRGGCTYYIYMLLFDLHTSPHFSSLKWGGGGAKEEADDTNVTSCLRHRAFFFLRRYRKIYHGAPFLFWTHEYG